MRALALLLLVPATARANELPARLSVERNDGAEQCSGREQLEQRVESILHRAWPSATTGDAIAIAVQFERARDGAFTAKVSSTGPKPGQRLLRDSSPTCQALSEAVAVAIALLLDSAQNETGGEPTPDAAPPPKPAPTETPAAPVTPSAPSAPTPWMVRAGLDVGGGYGLGGEGTALGAAHLGVRLSRFRIDASIAGTLPATQDFDGGDVSTSLLFGSLRGCYFVGHGFELGPCAHFGIGRLRGVGSGYGETQSSSLPWLAVGLGLGAEVALSSRVYVSLGATLWVPSERHTFSVENAGIAWESKRAASVATAGIGVTLF